MLLQEITKSVEWVIASGGDLKADWEEYRLKELTKWEDRAEKFGFRFPIFHSLADFTTALHKGRIFEVTKDDWKDIANLSRNSDLEELKAQVATYSTGPRDVDRIAHGIKNGAKIPLPIILKGKKGRHIMAGNTRLNVARILGVPQKAIELDVSK